MKNEKNYNVRLIILLSLFLAAIIWKPILVFIMPGILILFIPAFKKIDLITLIAYILGISMSFWIVSFWFLKYLPINLTNFFILISLITLLATTYFLIKKSIPYKITLKKYNFILIILFLFVIALRLIPIFYNTSSAGADMSVHTYVTQLIVNANGVPNNYHPILMINKFNSYPVGFPTISALISIVGNTPGFKGVFVFDCLTYAFFTLFLFVFLKRFISWEFAFISSVGFTFFTANPQSFSFSGGTPTIFALALFIFFISLLDRTENNNKWIIFFSAISLASVLLTHSSIFIQSFYVFGFSFLTYILLKKEYKNDRWIKYFLIIILFFMIITPYLINFDYEIATPKTQDKIKDWVRNTDHAWQGKIYDFIWTIPIYIKNYLIGRGPFKYSLFLCALGIIFLFNKNLKISLQYSIFLILSVLLILNTQYWVLPFSYAIYPEKVATMTVIPLSLFFAYALEVLFKYIKNKNFLNKKFLSIMLFSLIIFTMIFANIINKVYYVKGISRFGSVTEADLEAFDWLEKNTNKTDVIKNNHGDAGLWIPSIILRPVTSTQIHIIYLDKLKPIGEPKYIYIGKKCVYNCPLKNSDFKDDKKYESVYSNRGVHIYKILK